MSSTLLLPPADRRRRRLETEISRLQTQGIVPEEEVNKLQATEQQLQQTKATVTQLEQELKVQKSAAQAAKVQEAENKTLKEKDVQSQEQMIILKSDLAASCDVTESVILSGRYRGVTVRA